MARFEFPQNPHDGSTTTNDLTGVTYIYDSASKTWSVAGTSAEDNFATTAALNAESQSRIDEDAALGLRIDAIGTGPEADNPALPYVLTVGERDSVTGEDVSALQILETIALKDALGNNLGDVAFESSGGLGISLSTEYDYPVIKFQTNNIQDTTRYNKGRIYAEELRSDVLPRTYNIVNRTGVPTARPGEISVDTQKANEIKMISFGDTSSEGLSIGTVSVGDKLCITKIDNGRKYFYNIISGTTNSGIYGIDFIEEDSWYGTSNLQNAAHYLEIFPRATPFDVPVGSIMIWMNSDAPPGWFKLQGDTFDINTYPQLHAYLEGTSGYSSGRLPSWGGYYPGEYGDHLTESLGSKQGAKTAQPSGGAPSSSASFPDGNTRTFTTGGTHAFSQTMSKVTIDENWDDTTRPLTVVVHYIIKHD